MPPTIGQESGL